MQLMTRSFITPEYCSRRSLKHIIEKNKLDQVKTFLNPKNKS